MKASETYTFDMWLDEMGTTRVCRLLGVAPMTVRYWRARVNYPRVEQIRKIKKLTKGVVTYEMIIDRGIRRRHLGSI